MTYSCAYCERRATGKIPSTPEAVCAAHAREFWTGLLAYAVNGNATAATAVFGVRQMSEWSGRSDRLGRATQPAPLSEAPAAGQEN